MHKKLIAALLAMGLMGFAVAQEKNDHDADDKAKSAAHKTADTTKDAAHKTADTTKGAANKTGDVAKGAVAGGKEAAGKPQNVKITKGPVVEWVGDSHATIAWSTNVRSSSVLRYGTDPNNLTQQAKAPYGGPTHRVKLSNLQPATKYYFVLDSGQGEGTGTEAKSEVNEFQTVAKGEKGKKYSMVKAKR